MAEQENETTETKETSPQDNEEQANSTEEEQQENTGENQDGINSDKVVEKLQKRIGKEQSEKNDYATRLKQAEEELRKYKNGDVKKLSEEEKNKKYQDESQKKIKDLENRLQIAETTKQTDQVFKDAGLNVGDDVLKMVVSTDADATYSNAKALIDLVNQTREDARKNFLKGSTPKANGSAIKTASQDEFNRMSYKEKAKLAKENPENFRKLTGGR